MRWAPIVEAPERDGQYFCTHAKYGKCVMGFRDGSWGAYPPDFWLQADQCGHQAPNGVFERQPMDLKAYPIEDAL